MKQLKGKLFCFSPPVMLATFLFETGAALYIIWRYKETFLLRLIAALLVLLATFQLAEFMVCEGKGLDSIMWARIGYVAITLLPPLGIHIIQQIAGFRKHWIVTLPYLLSLPFIYFFASAKAPFYGHACLGNYVIFQIPNWVSTWYTAYYYLLLALGLGLAWFWGRKMTHKKHRQALFLFALGYVSFILPTAIVSTFSSQALHAVPSIMCGFAVILAAISVWGVLPLVDKKKHKRHNTQ